MASRIGTIPPEEAIERIWEDIGSFVLQEDWDDLNERFGDDHAIEFFSYVVATYPIADCYSHLKEIFPPAINDGKTYNASRKNGNCYCWAFTAILGRTYPQISDDAVYLIHGFGPFRGGGFTGHAWLETGDKVIDCGLMYRKFTVHEKTDYYSGTTLDFPSDTR